MIKLRIALFTFILLLVFGCTQNVDEKDNSNSYSKLIKPTLVVLGTAQDAGFPQIGCIKSCCADLWDDPERHKMVSSLGLIDPSSGKTWIFDASPDFKRQTKILSDLAGNKSVLMPDGIFLTHGHMGHYTGLMHLGREAHNSSNVAVFAMPKMHNYLKKNGPWSQLVNLENIAIQPLAHDSTIEISQKINVTPLLVPHRGEYTETVGYRIEGPTNKALFIPDIDKWNLWDRDIIEEIRKVDYAFVDATFYQNGEVGNRDMSEIPHPFVEESLKLFVQLPDKEKSKIYLIHFNHTNPLLNSSSKAYQQVMDLGFHIAEEGLQLEL
ncbi:MAG: MBL fold metallo-hydrolase [Marinoscillum sp.]